MYQLRVGRLTLPPEEEELLPEEEPLLPEDELPDEGE